MASWWEAGKPRHVLLTPSLPLRAGSEEEDQGLQGLEEEGQGEKGGRAQVPLRRHQQQEEEMLLGERVSVST